jgi:hypothetical protein
VAAITAATFTLLGCGDDGGKVMGPAKAGSGGMGGTGGTGGTSGSGGTGGPPGPRGLYALGDPSGARNIKDLDFVAGFTARFGWNLLETGPDTYDFSKLDAVAAALEPLHQKLTVEILVADTPAHVLEGLTETWMNSSGTTVGVPWDDKLISAWDDFNRALAEHQVARSDGTKVAFADHPVLATLNAPIVGLGSVRELTGTLVTLPDYDRQKLIDGALRSIHSVRDRFPGKDTFVGFFRMTDADDSVPLDEALGEAMLDEFVRGQPDTTFGFFQENLADSTPDPNTFSKLFLELGSESWLMFQALTPWLKPFQGMEDSVTSGTPVTGVEFAYTAFGARYVELYPSDLDDTKVQAALRPWGQCLLTDAGCP